MSARVWHCEQLVHPPLAREDVRLWTSTSVTLFTRGGPRLVLETGGPFSLSGIVITLPVSPRLEVQHKGPLALDFRIQLAMPGQTAILLAVFSEVDGLELVEAVQRAGASLRVEVTHAWMGVRPGQGQEEVDGGKTMVRKVSRSTWYVEEEEEEDQEDAHDISLAAFLTSSSPTPPEVLNTSAPLLGQYFSTLPRVTRKLFRSEANLPRASSAVKLDFLQTRDMISEAVFDPATIGLFSDPAVVRFEFTDYPDSVYTEQTPEDSLSDKGDWIRRSCDNLLADHTDNPKQLHRGLSRSLASVLEPQAGFLRLLGGEELEGETEEDLDDVQGEGVETGDETEGEAGVEEEEEEYDSDSGSDTLTGDSASETEV